MVGRLVGWLVGWLVGLSAGWPVFWLVGLLILSVGRLVRWMVCRPVGWMVCRPVGRLVGRSIARPEQMLLRDSRERCLGSLGCCGLNGAAAVVAVSVIALFIVLIVWCFGCSEWTSDEVGWTVNLSFEMYIFPERKRERMCEQSYAIHVDKNVLKCDCVKYPLEGL